MASRALPKEEWQTYCDRISKGLAGQRAHIEVTGLALGDQVAAKEPVLSRGRAPSTKTCTR
jgi:hypothetical protein